MDFFTIESIRSALSTGTSGPSGRPVSQLSFALNYLWTGFDPFAFKLTNVIIHCLNGILVFLVSEKLISAAYPSYGKRDHWLFAGAVALAWGLHPIQLTSVLYVVQRMTSLSAFFLLIAFLLHITARRREIFGKTAILQVTAAWLVCWPLSIACKETGVLFPIFVAAYEFILRKDAQGGLDKFGRTYLILLVGTASGLALYMLSPLADWLWAGYEIRSFTLTERLLTESRVIWSYLGLILTPGFEAFSLYHDDVAVSTGLLRPWTTLAALIGNAGLLAAIWSMRKRFPLVAFGGAFFLIGHGLESTVLPLEIMHEHRNYLPLLGLCFMLAGFAADFLRTAEKQKKIAITLCAVIIAYLGSITALRAHLYGNEWNRTQIEAQHHPDSTRTIYDAAIMLDAAFDANKDNQFAYVLARNHYLHVGDLDPNFKLGLLGLIHLDCMLGKSPDHKFIDELARRLRETPLAPADRNILFNIVEMSRTGAICLEKNDVDKLFESTLANPGAQSMRTLLLSWQTEYHSNKKP
ncbi:MAG: pilus assembly protein PilF [Sulfuricella sp.]|nr:pilus assembly protein PilF [Sulfuricella sp.]